MRPTKYMLMATVFLVGTTLAANAQVQQVQYAPPPPVAYNYPFLPPLAVQPYVQTTPPEWSYDPYTSGLGPCPQRLPGDPPCRETVHPSYGQPNYWPQ
jgi:hypothetical protein